MGRYNVIALLLALTALVAAPRAGAEWSASWTLAELHQSLVDAQKSDDRLQVLLANKVYDAMRQRQLRFINGNLVYSTSAPGFRDGVDGYNADATKDLLFDVVNGLSPVKYTGKCDVPLPAFSLQAVESPGATFSGSLYGDETFLFGHASPGQIQLGVYATGRLRASTGIGLVWGGMYPEPGTEYRCDIPVPPYPCGSLFHPRVCDTVCGWVPTVTMKCRSWTDSTGVKAEAEFAGSLVATLNTAFTATDRRITLNKHLALTGEISAFSGINSDLPPFTVTGRLVPYVTPDIWQISGPTESSPISAQILAQTVGLPVAADAAVLGALGPLAPAASVLQAQAGALYGLSLVGIEQQWVRDAYQGFIAQQNAAFDAAGYNDPIVIELPADVNDQLLRDVLQLLHNMGISDFLTEFVRANLHEILYYLLTNDRAALDQLFAGAAACQAVNGLTVPMKNVPLYGRDTSGNCAAADVNGTELAHYYTDAACTLEVAYRPTTAQEYCNVILAPSPNALLGNAAAWAADSAQPNDVAPSIPSRKWTQWQGTRLPLPAESIAPNYAPYMKQVRYRDVTSAGHAGTCALEMRVYKKDITAQNRPALLAFHGGSWTYRGAAFTAFESTISHYTERGFVVFAPFYRLVGANEGDAACNQAQWQEVVSDAEAALDWVKANGGLFGAVNGKVAVTGQSAGAHLSGWLVTHRPDDVAAALLHYPPADVLDFVANARVGGSYEPWIGSLGILNSFYGSDLSTVDVSNPPNFVLQNSFARWVQSAAQPLPPVFILHGVADSLVPSNQSVQLCNAYGGAAVNSGGGTALRAVYGCGSTGGQLHLFEQGEHGLDACVTSGLCLSGSAASAALVADSERKGRDWLYARTEQPIVLPVAGVSGTGGAGKAAAVTDGNLGTVWAGRKNDYLQLDLGVVRPVGGIGAVWGGAIAPSATAFVVTTSIDGVHWTQALAAQGGRPTPMVQVYGFATVDARYVRFAAQGSSRYAPIFVSELRAYGPVLPTLLSTTPIKRTLAANVKSALANGWDRLWNHKRDHARSWTEYDLGTSADVAHLMIGVPHSHKVEIQFSSDGQEWKSAGTVSGSGHIRLLDLREVTARYVRVDGPGEGSDDKHQHGEHHEWHGDHVKLFAVYGARP